MIHWVANAKTTAKNNRDYFNNLPSINANNNKKGLKSTYGSAHEVIGLDGEVVLCIPDNETAYHVGSKTYTNKAKKLIASYPNRYSYGIECCHPDWIGKFNNKTYTTLINRVADLCIKFNLKPSKNTIWRHYDVVGWKDCPRYYVKNPKEWDQLIKDVQDIYNKKINKKTDEVIKLALQQWQKDMGEQALKSLNKKKDSKGQLIVDKPENWKKSLSENTPQWLFWSIVDRVTNK